MTESANNNQQLIDDLRAAAEYFEAHPLLMELPMQRLMDFVRTKAELQEAARNMGAFTKEFSPHYFTLTHKFGRKLLLEVSISRDEVCKRIVTWECPDDESLLRMLTEGTEDPR